MSTPSFNNGSVVKCYGCQNWFRVIATEVISSSEATDSFSPQRWCFACLADVDSNTDVVIRSIGTVPDSFGTPDWDSEESSEEESE